MSNTKNVKRRIVDTNIIIRFITNDPSNMAEQLNPYLQQVADGTLIWVIDTMVVAESVWVLQTLKDAQGNKLYTKQQISQTLKKLIMTPGVETAERNLLIDTLNDYANCNVDFVDAYLAAKSRASGEDILTWNVNDFHRLGVTYDEPQ